MALTNPYPQSARTRKGKVRPYDAMNFALDIAAFECNKAGLINGLTTVTARQIRPTSSEPRQMTDSASLPVST